MGKWSKVVAVAFVRNFLIVFLTVCYLRLGEKSDTVKKACKIPT
jgi:hypothetical protein